jgi:predicted RNA-binding protein
MMKTPTFTVQSPQQGLKVLQHKDIVRNWRNSLNVEPQHRTAVLVPCSATKPFYDSPSHLYGYIPALQRKKVDVFIVSEPLGIVPYQFSAFYPNNDYDFPPKHVKGETRELLVDRFAEWFNRIGSQYDRIYAALPLHHMALVEDARGSIPVKDVSISQMRSDTGKDVYRANTKAYVDYLRRKIK